jgi:isoleucyl-tRNA synthetase
MTQDKINAYLTLYTALVTLAKAAAPMVPFLSESIYRNLVCSVDKTAPVSVHLCDWPEVDGAWIDGTLEARMKAVLDITVLGRSARNAASIKNRQPIGRMIVKAEEVLPSFFCDIIKDELNVKEVAFTDSVREFTTYVFKPQLKTVGPKYGKFLGEIRNALANVDGNAAMDELKATGVLKLALSSVTAELLEEDLLIEMVKKEGFEAASDMGITVVLDCNLTAELLEEGFVNELVSKIQTMRKDSGFEVVDRIKVGITGNEKLIAIARRNEAALLGAVLGVELAEGDLANAKSWDINGEKAVISVEKI